MEAVQGSNATRQTPAAIWTHEDRRWGVEGDREKLRVQQRGNRWFSIRQFAPSGSRSDSGQEFGRCNQTPAPSARIHSSSRGRPTAKMMTNDNRNKTPSVITVTATIILGWNHIYSSASKPPRPLCRSCAAEVVGITSLQSRWFVILRTEEADSQKVKQTMSAVVASLFFFF